MDRKQKVVFVLKQNWIFCLFFAGMIFYYGYNMFAIKPWYDELYTYYSFISRGPIYSAIHWPVPNNHVFYSVLSAFLDYLGNPYIGLRGISYLAAVANMFLLYRFARRFVDNYLAAGVVFLYTAVYQVNYLSVQGRGYTLSITFYLLTLLCLYKICQEQATWKEYVVYALSLTGGLYTLISSTFWVIPVCLTGGVVLLFLKRYKTLRRLIGASLLAAAMTLFLYTLIWLAIGSNLMSKDPANMYYGVYQVTIILKTPFEALRTGMEYMLATPYIQGDARSYIIAELFSYLTALFNLFYAEMGAYLTILCGILGIGAIAAAIKNCKKDFSKWFFNIYLAVTVVMLPLMLIIQSVQPYYRVFTFLAVPVSLLLVWFFSSQAVQGAEKSKLWISRGCCVVFGVISLLMLTNPSYNAQYAERETEIAQIVEEDVSQMESIFYADDYQKYVLKFYFDKEPIELPLKEAQYVLLPKEVYDEEYEIPVWPTLYGHEGLDLEYLHQEFDQIKTTDSYELYKRK